VFALDEAMIARLRPDVLVTQALCEVCAVSETDVRALASRLQTLGVASPEVVTLCGTTLAGVFDDVRRVAERLGRAPQGELLLEKLHIRLRAVHEQLKTHRAPRPRMAVIEWTDPLYAAGHWMPELVHRAGGIDVLASPGAHSHPIALDVLVAADPEIICVAPCGFHCSRAAEEAGRLRSLPEWQPLRDRQIWALDANALTSRAGPRLVEAVEVLAAIGNPGLFPELPEHRARRIA
jgi:iron complex transport system substrate-binding protein